MEALLTRIRKQPPQKKLRRPAVADAVAIGATSALLIVSCIWQKHIQAGDLSSHLYNAWLAGEVKRGRIQGLHLVPVWTNALCDRILEGLLFWKGPNFAERATVAGAVLLFFGGAFFLVKMASKRRPWDVCPGHELGKHFGLRKLSSGERTCTVSIDLAPPLW